MDRAVPVLLVSAMIAAAPATTAAQEPDEVQTYSQPIYSESITEEYRVPTEHGTIYGLVRRPVVPEGVTVPVILTYSPYNVLSRPVNLPDPSLNDSYASFYVPRGYARAVFDLVGTRESSGCYDFGGIAERETGAAVVDFLGSQPWSNGKVAMIGASYDGTTAYAAAVEAPEHLATIVPQVAIDRWYDYPYHGGVRRYSGFGTPLLFDFGFAATPPTGANDPEHMAEVAATRVQPCRRVVHQIRGFGHDPIYDSFWDERDYRSRVDDVTASVLVEGGWQDTNVNRRGSVRFFQALPDDHPKKIVMGQWGHSTPNLPDWSRIRHAWFDYWLLGYDGLDDEDDLPDTRVMDLPRMDSVIGGSGERVRMDTWPPPETATVPLRLVTGAPGSPTELGLEGGEPSFSTATPPVFTGDAMRGECDGGCVTFLGPPIESPVRIAGAPVLDLAARSVPEGPDQLVVSTQYVVLLFFETPAGTRQLITTGMLNSRNRSGERTSEDVAAGEPYEGPVELTDTDYEVPAGSRLGIAIGHHILYEDILPDDDPPTVNEILLAEELGTGLRLPVAAGHESFPPPAEEPEAGTEEALAAIPDAMAADMGLRAGQR